MIEDRYLDWLKKNKKRLLIKRCLGEVFEKFPLYLISFEILLLYNVFIAPTGKITNTIIEGTIASHLILIFLKNCIRAWKKSRNYILLRLEQELSIPHNFLSSAETVDNYPVRKILIEKLTPYFGKKVEILQAKRKKILGITSTILFLTVIASPSTFLKIVTSPFMNKGGAKYQIVNWVSDLIVEVHPPPYTGEPSYQLKGVEKFPIIMGAILTIKFTTLTPAKNAKLETPRNKTLSFRKDGDIFIISFTPVESGKYLIHLERNGKWFTDTTNLNISLTKDKPPVVKILKPDKNLTIRLDESVLFEVKATDDFGIRKLKIVMLNGNEKKEEDAGSEISGKSVDLNWTFLPEKEGFNEGDTVVIYFYAEDNNDFNGPNRGKSREIKIEIFSPVKAHRKLIKKEQHILDLLVDALDLAIRRVVYREKKDIIWNRFISQIIGRINNLLDQLREDQFTGGKVVAFFENLRGKLVKIPSPQQGKLKVISTLENLIIELDNILKEERLQQIKLYQDQINFLKEKLQNLLNQYRKTQDPEIFKEIEDTLKEIQQKIVELETFIKETTPYHLPDQFVNSEAYRNLSSGKLQKEIEKLRKDLKKKDRDSVIKEAEDLLHKLSHFNNALKKAEERYSATLQTISAQLHRLEQELDFVSKEHRKYLKSLQRYNERINKQATSQIQKTIKRIMKRLKENIPSFYLYSERIRNKIAKIEGGNNLKALKQLLKDLENLPGINRNWIKDLKNEIVKTEKNIKKLQNKTSLKFFENENRRFKKRLEEISKQLNIITSKYPHLTGKTADMLEKSMSEINQANNYFKQFDSLNGYIKEKKAQFWIDEALNNLKKQRKEIEKEQKIYKGKKTGKGGYSKTSGQPLKENVKIPPPSREYGDKRKEIIRSLEEGFPQPYRKINREYFKELME